MCNAAEAVEKVVLEALVFHRSQIVLGFLKSKSVSVIFLAGYSFIDFKELTAPVLPHLSPFLCKSIVGYLFQIVNHAV